MMVSAFHLGELVLHSGIVHAHSLAWLTGTLIRMEPSLTSLVTPVVFLLCQVKMSALRGVYTITMPELYVLADAEYQSKTTAFDKMF